MNIVKASYSFPTGQILEISQGDLAEETLDAIVNAANAYLSHGAGVAVAIVRKGGEAIQEESDAWVKQFGLVTHAEPAYTGPGRLRCRYVIHAVGPVWGEGEEDRKLAEAIRGSLRLAESLGLQSVALPALSTGIFGFPKARAAQVIFEAIRDYFQENCQAKVNHVRLTIIDEPTVNTFLEVFYSWAGRLSADKNPG